MSSVEMKGLGVDTASVPSMSSSEQFRSRNENRKNKDNVVRAAKMISDAVINSHKGKAFWLSTDVTGISESRAHRIKKGIVFVVDVIRTLTIFVMVFATICERPMWCYDDDSYDEARTYDGQFWRQSEEYFISNNLLVVLDLSCLVVLMLTVGMRVYMSFAEMNDYAIFAVWTTFMISRIMEFSTTSNGDHDMEKDAALASALCRMILVMLVSRPIRCGLYVHIRTRK